MDWSIPLKFIPIILNYPCHLIKGWLCFLFNRPLRVAEKERRCPDRTIDLNIMRGTVTPQTLWVIHITNQSAKEIILKGEHIQKIKYSIRDQKQWTKVDTHLSTKLINEAGKCEDYNGFLPKRCTVEIVWSKRPNLTAQYDIRVPYKYEGQPENKTSIQVKDYR